MSAGFTLPWKIRNETIVPTHGCDFGHLQPRFATVVGTRLSRRDSKPLLKSGNIMKEASAGQLQEIESEFRVLEIQLFD